MGRTLPALTPRKQRDLDGVRVCETDHAYTRLLRKMLRLLVAAVALCLACAHAPPVHPRAVENNTLCAQYVVQGDLVKAETYCDLALEFSPEYAEAWSNKGFIAFKRNKIDEAKRDLIKALHFNQELAQAYNVLGYIYLKEGAFGRAHDNFARALKVNPDMTEARYNLALAYTGLKQRAEAKKELRTLIAVAPNLADPHNTLGVVLAQEGNREEAVNELLQAIQLDPNYADAYLNLGITEMELAKFNDAAEAFKSCLKSDPENIPCANNLPIANRKNALSDPKRRLDREEISRQPSAARYYQAGQVDHERGLLAEEESDYKHCIQLDGKYVPCHYGLYLLFKQDQKTRNANSACKNVLSFAAVEDFPTEVEDCRKFLGASPL